MPRAFSSRMLTAIACFVLFASLVPPSSQPRIVHAEGSEPGLQHCTDWPSASYHEGSESVDEVLHVDKQYLIGSRGEIPLPVIPESPDWRVLVRGCLKTQQRLRATVNL